VAFLDDGRVETDTNVVERAIRPNASTRKDALFAGSDGGARSWAKAAKVPSASADGMLPEGVAMTLIQTAKLNGVEPTAWFTDVLERVVSGRTKAHELYSQLPWNGHATSEADRPATA